MTQHAYNAQYSGFRTRTIKHTLVKCGNNIP